MLKISKLADYATVIMSFIAEKPDDPHSAAQVAEKTNLNLPTASKVLKLLNEANLLISTRGANGGYQLNGSENDISLVDIIAAVDGNPAMIECSMGKHICSIDHVCKIRGNWQVINQKILQVLGEISLAEMNKPMSVPMKFFQNAHQNRERQRPTERKR